MEVSYVSHPITFLDGVSPLPHPSLTSNFPLLFPKGENFASRILQDKLFGRCLKKKGEEIENLLLNVKTTSKDKFCQKQFLS